MEKNQKAITTIRAGVIKFACKLDNIDNRNRELKNQAWNACDKDNAKLRSAYIFWWEYEFALYKKSSDNQSTTIMISIPTESEAQTLMIT